MANQLVRALRFILPYSRRSKKDYGYYVMLIISLIYVISIGGILGIALTDYLNQGRRGRLLFVLFSILVAVWLSAQFGAWLLSSKADTSLHLIQLSSAISVWLGVTFFLFTEKYLHDSLNKIILFILIVSGTILSLLNASPDLMISDATSNLEGIAINSAGSLYYAQIMFIVGLFLVAVGKIIYSTIHLEKKYRKQNYFLILSIFQAVVLVGVATVFFSTSAIAQLVIPISCLIMVVLISIGIIRYHLFDVRYLAFRLLGYVISLAIITTLFTVIAFGLTSIVFYNENIPIEVELSYVLTATVIALCFGPIKNFVNKNTNQIFFQQNYSVHDSLSEISSYATRSVDATRIQRHSLEVLEKTIRPEYAGFIMFNSEGKLIQASHQGGYPLNELGLPEFLKTLSKLHEKVTLEENVTESHTLRHYFELSHIGLITRLSTSNKSIGYLVLGEKKNGSTYNAHDLQFLTLAANDLALALQNARAFEEIQQFNATLQNKINNATKALKRTNAKLVALDDAKDEFISMASHQLRTPLTSVKGYISMMLEGDLGKISATQRQALKEAFDSSQRMVFLISDFLNVSRIRTGKFTIEENPTNLLQIVEEEIGQLRDMAGLRNQKIEYTPPKAFPLVSLDENKIRQVMMNMIDNAIFYTPRDGHIKIVLEKTKDEIIFKVIDDGIGVPQKDQHRLFTKFFRAENARDARPDGTGLGLFMAQKIITAQEGKIIFQSEEGKGSTFGFRFPMEKIK